MPFNIPYLLVLNNGILEPPRKDGTTEDSDPTGIRLKSLYKCLAASSEGMLGGSKMP